MAKTVLVVDDDPTQRRLVQAVLEREGFAVAQAENGGEAIDCLTKGGGADVVLLDEPASNLDAQGMAWLHRVLEDIRRTTTVVVATNDPQREAPKALSLLEIEK